MALSVFLAPHDSQGFCHLADQVRTTVDEAAVELHQAGAGLDFLGRILAAIGYAGVMDLDVSKLRVWLGDGQEEVLVAEKGGRAASYVEEAGARIMQNAEITVRADLARGEAAATVWTCDFSYDYVKINADYRS